MKAKCIFQKDYENFITFRWMLTKWCNYNCSYCNQVKGEKTAEEKLIEDAVKINELVKGFETPVKIRLLGGEISFYNLPELLDKITADNFKSLVITTNFSNDFSVYEELKAYCNGRNISLLINCSYHDAVTIQEYVEKVELIKDYALIQFTLTEKNQEEFLQLKTLCDEKQVVWRTDPDKRRGIKRENYLASDHFMKAFYYVDEDNNYNEIDSATLRRELELPKLGYSCHADRSVFIDDSGIMYDGTCINRQKIGELATITPKRLKLVLQKKGAKDCDVKLCTTCMPVKIFTR